MSLLAIFSENTFFKTQGTKLHGIVTQKKGLD